MTEGILQVSESKGHLRVVERKAELLLKSGGYQLLSGEGVAAQSRRKAEHYSEINAARNMGRVVAWDGLLLEAVFSAIGEQTPEVQHERLLELAAVAVANAVDLGDQLDSFEAVEVEENDGGDK